ncbi:hypothetical protein GCM10010140_60410 [Streptosporangium pseudovulgare]|uniref:Uncharacterized protein n=1 Tax=Streptosporangium pseudovulgare TaxID=35765 RepID=A0ABQ2RE57_9ACTN|nr:hypothetical protein GCM10010140_60410 [Streptosporangium pseudovulgare]
MPVKRGDGDTDGWVVVLIAPLDDPQHEVDLTCIRQGADLRVLNGQVPPWPEAQEAMETGTALAEHFSMPFHFASPYWPSLPPSTRAWTDSAYLRARSGSDPPRTAPPAQCSTARASSPP